MNLRRRAASFTQHLTLSARVYGIENADSRGLRSPVDI